MPQCISRREPQPLIYDLDTDNGTSLTITVSTALYNYLQSLLTPDKPIIIHLAEALGLAVFIDPSSRNWGYGQCLETVNNPTDGDITIRCQLPVILPAKQAKSGQTSNWDKAYCISATLQILFMACEIFNEQTSGRTPPCQLVKVRNWYTARELHGGSLSVDLSPAVCEFLSGQPHNNQLQPVLNNMRTAYFTMQPGKSVRRLMQYEFQALCRQPQWINLSIPGNACGLDPSDYNCSRGQGYLLYPHNVDSPLQQLTLLVGVATLNQMVRRETAQ